MLIIRNEQITALSQHATQRFVDRLATELGDELPRRCMKINVQEMIYTGIDRAREYDVVSEQGVGRYVRLMLIFGRDFDRDSRFPWAGAVFKDRAITDEATRMDKLTEASIAYVRSNSVGIQDK